MRPVIGMPSTSARSCAAIAGFVTVSWACAAPPATEELERLTYEGIYRDPVTLTDGVYEGEPYVPGGASRPRVQLIGKARASADLDGDGAVETAVLLSASSGGSGEYLYLAVVRGNDGHYRNVATRRIGDRVKVRSLASDGDSLVLQLVTAGPEEPSCCPTLRQRNVYRLEGDALVETESLKLGHLTVADLCGVNWRLTALDRDEPVPDGVEVTAVFEADKVSGNAGCNHYFAGVGGGPYDLHIGPAGSTRMACAPPLMAVEDRYLTALRNVRQFSFLYGALALTYAKDEGTGTLLFVPSGD